MYSLKCCYSSGWLMAYYHYSYHRSRLHHRYGDTLRYVIGYHYRSCLNMNPNHQCSNCMYSLKCCYSSG